MRKITILIADDQPILRSGLRELLKDNNHLEVVGEAANGKEVVKLAVSLKPEVIIMNLFMPKLNGVEAAKQLNKKVPNSKILMLSDYQHDYHLLAAMQTQVDGFLYKNIDISELVSTIEKINAGNHVVDQNAAFNILSDMVSDNNADFEFDTNAG